MPKRFVAIWFPFLITDWHTLRRPELKRMPFVIAAPVNGRMVVKGGNPQAREAGIDAGTALADARALTPALEVANEDPALAERLLKGIAEWFIRYTPVVAIDPPDGLILEATGCAHLWGGETEYLANIMKKISGFGYHIRLSIADSIGGAWAFSRFGPQHSVTGTGKLASALLPLPAQALRLETGIVERLQKLGLGRIRDFIAMPRPVLSRRFGQQLIQRLDQALGYAEEQMKPVQPVVVYQERLPCMEPIITATGIAIALQRLLDSLCNRLQSEGKGLRSAIFKGYRVDGKLEKIEIATNRSSHHKDHLFRLFEMQLSTIEPALGIELFLLEAPKVEKALPAQEKLWTGARGLEDEAVSELLDRLTGRYGASHIHSYLPDEHYWPERSFRPAISPDEPPATAWSCNRPRPVLLLPKPEPVEVTVPVPDYPPMQFRHKGQLHKVARADGPERIEQEWWIQEGEHRDYYCVEDDAGRRYWLFRLGHYGADKPPRWFLHGFFS